MQSAITFRRLALALACGSLFAAGAALAQDAQQNPPPSADPAASQPAPGAADFKTLDSNADGSVSKDEAVADAELTRDFDKFDVNGDGKLSETEFAATGRTAPPSSDGDQKP